MILRIILGLLALGIAFCIPLYFDAILYTLVRQIGLGWVFSTILIRVLVILFLALSLKQFFALSPRLKKIKAWVVVLIALVPGFGISFIAPIYETDYGMMNTGAQLTGIDALQNQVQATIVPEKGHAVLAFFTTGCPHCANASRKLGANLDGGQTIPVYTFFPGTEEKTDQFLKKNDGEKFTSYTFDNDSLFTSLAGVSFPSIFVVDEKGQTLYHWIGDEMNYSALDYLQTLKN